MPRLNFTEKRAIPEDTLLAWPRNFDKNIFLWLSNLQYFYYQTKRQPVKRKQIIEIRNGGFSLHYDS